MNPVWKPFEIDCGRLCGNNFSNQIKVVCLDDQEDKNYRYIGEFWTSIEEINRGSRHFVLKERNKDNSRGIIEITNFRLVKQPSFLEYLKAGERINVIYAIDFTQSNGEPDLPNSLHRLGQG